MRYSNYDELCLIVSEEAMTRYLDATNSDKDKAIILYYLNMKLCKELYELLGFFEHNLRTKIQNFYALQFSNPDWLYHNYQKLNFFDFATKSQIEFSLAKMQEKHIRISSYTLISEMSFGFWRSLFNKANYAAGGKTLIKIFPNRPKGTPKITINHSYIYNKLTTVNKLRNQIAHYEPLCFDKNTKSTQYARSVYALIFEVFTWMNLDQHKFIDNLTEIETVLNEIDAL